jgi:hypothetical protein
MILLLKPLNYRYDIIARATQDTPNKVCYFFYKNVCVDPSNGLYILTVN